ncbi:hypothetical protein KBTX_02959 [wastewater metagenome]|uniref:Cyclophilin-like domain-containing protein n=3 Tax=root TaxID=1 RepID=A0A5B8RBW9_9ZZZZ|nr:hypothetical protein KBTEX_02959 [uncultured organism]
MLRALDRRFLRTAIGGVALLGACVAYAGNTRSEPTEDTMRIRITVEDTELVARLEDTPAARDFAAMLPLELTLEDFHATEKIADLPSRLSTEGAPKGVDPDVGDVTYYAPWGNLALFYRDFGYANGLVRLGRIEGDVSALEARGALRTRIELIDPPQ